MLRLCIIEVFAWFATKNTNQVEIPFRFKLWFKRHVRFTQNKHKTTEEHKLLLVMLSFLVLQYGIKVKVKLRVL